MPATDPISTDSAPYDIYGESEANHARNPALPPEYSSTPTPGVDHLSHFRRDAQRVGSTEASAVVRRGGVNPLLARVPQYLLPFLNVGTLGATIAACQHAALSGPQTAAAVIGVGTVLYHLNQERVEHGLAEEEDATNQELERARHQFADESEPLPQRQRGLLERVPLNLLPFLNIGAMSAAFYVCNNAGLSDPQTAAVLIGVATGLYYLNSARIDQADQN